MREVFGAKPRSRMALETGMHSPWVSRLLLLAGSCRGRRNNEINTFVYVDKTQAVAIIIELQALRL
jgi:hypothetical protein